MKNNMIEVMSELVTPEQIDCVLTQHLTKMSSISEMYRDYHEVLKHKLDAIAANDLAVTA